MAESQIQSKQIVAGWRFPELNKLENIPANKSYREQAFEKLKDISKRLVQINKQTKEEHQSYVELANGTTVGIGAGDIQLTQSEVDNLLKIKELLNGCKIVIYKGDIRIEVE
jgi:hypothetical protein